MRMDEWMKEKDSSSKRLGACKCLEDNTRLFAQINGAREVNTLRIFCLSYLTWKAARNLCHARHHPRIPCRFNT